MKVAEISTLIYKSCWYFSNIYVHCEHSLWKLLKYQHLFIKVADISAIIFLCFYNKTLTQIDAEISALIYKSCWHFSNNFSSFPENRDPLYNETLIGTRFTIWKYDRDASLISTILYLIPFKCYFSCLTLTFSAHRKYTCV